MNTKQIAAIVVVVIVIIAAVAAAIVLIGDDDDNETQYRASSTDCHLWVYGNVNGDDYIDQADIDLLEKIIAGEEYEVYVTIYDGYNAYNSTSRISFADANQDGVLDQKDVQFIKDLMAYEERYAAAVDAGNLDTFNEEFTLYYNNCDNVVATAKLPMKSVIAVYFNNCEIMSLLGAADRVIASDSTVIGNKPTLLPEYQDLPDIGNRFSVSAEAVLASGADTFFTGSASTYSEYMEEQTAGLVNVVRLPAWEDNNVMAGTLTMGYLLGSTTMAYEYIDWCNYYIDLVSERLETVTGNVTCICPKGRASGNCLEGNGLGSGQFEITELAGAINLAAELPANDEYPDFSQEWVLTKNVQFIILSGYAGFESYTADKIQTNVYDVIDLAYEVYAGTPAAMNGQIYFIANEIFTGPSAIVAMVYCATWFYPDLFEDLNGTDVFQEYIDKFRPALADYDVTEHIEQFVYGPKYR